MRTLGKKKTTVVANPVKKLCNSDRSLGNKSGNKSFFNRSTNTYVADLRKNNSKLARALTAQKMMTLDFYNRLSAYEKKYVYQQGLLRNLSQNVKEKLRRFKVASDAIIQGLYDVSDVLLTLNTDLEKLNPEVVTSDKAQEVIHPDTPQPGNVENKTPQEAPPNEVDTGGSPSSRHGAAKPMVKGQAISTNPSVKLQRVNVSGRYTEDHFLSTSQLNNRLSPLIEESDDSISSTHRKSVSYPSPHRSIRKVSSPMQLPSSCVMLERIDQTHKISLSPEDASPKTLDISAEQASFGHVHNSIMEAEETDDSPRTMFNDSKKAEVFDCSSDEEDLATRIKQFNNSSRFEEDPMEGTSWDFDEFGNYISDLRKKKKKAKNALVKTKINKKKKQQIKMPMVAGSGTDQDNFSHTLHDVVDMSFTECIPAGNISSLENLQSTHSGITSSVNQHEQSQESLNRLIPLVHVERIDDVKQLESPSMDEPSKSGSQSCEKSPSCERKMFVTHRARKDPRLQHHTKVVSPSPSKKGKHGNHKQENMENTATKVIKNSDKELVFQKPSSSNSHELYPGASVVLERLPTDAANKCKESNNSFSRSPRCESSSQDLIPTPQEALRVKSTVNVRSPTVNKDAIESENKCVSDSPLQKNFLSVQNLRDSCETDEPLSTKSKKTSLKKRKIEKPKSKSVGHEKKQTNDSNGSYSSANVALPRSTASTDNFQANASDSDSSTSSESRSRYGRIKIPRSYKEPSLTKKLRRS